MSTSRKGSDAWYVSNRYNAEAACKHCGRVIRHEPWCIMIDPLVRYAYEILVDPSKLTLTDALILHSLGVTWGEAARSACAEQ